VGTVCGTASDGSALLALVERESPDVVVTDLSMPEVSGFEVLRAIAQRPAPPPVVVLTVHADVGTLRAALAAGAAGYVVKSAASSELITAITTVMRGEQYIPPALRDLAVAAPATAVETLSVRQRAVLEALARGLGTKQVAAALGVSERTVAFHKDQLRKRLGVHSVVEMMDLLRRTSGYAADGVGPVD
jgi:DNA-binding NarL/FixJ family response regulator